MPRHQDCAALRQCFPRTLCCRSDPRRLARQPQCFTKLLRPPAPCALSWHRCPLWCWRPSRRPRQKSRSSLSRRPSGTPAWSPRPKPLMCLPRRRCRLSCSSPTRPSGSARSATRGWTSRQQRRRQRPWRWMRQLRPRPRLCRRRVTAPSTLSFDVISALPVPPLFPGLYQTLPPV